MPPGALPGSLFEVIVAPSWRQVGSKAGFWKVGTPRQKIIDFRGFGRVWGGVLDRRLRIVRRPQAGCDPEILPPKKPLLDDRLAS